MKWTDVPALLAKPGAQMHWDATSSTPYVDYTSTDGHMHEAWYENPQSIQTKTALVKQLGLGGMSVWALGDEDLSFWQAAYAGLH
jgi:spore germination protein YaaH